MSSGWGTYKDDLEAGTVSFTVPFLLLLFDVMSLLYSRSMESRRFNGETMCRSVRQVFSEASLWVIRKVSISAPRACVGREQSEIVICPKLGLDAEP